MDPVHIFISQLITDAVELVAIPLIVILGIKLRDFGEAKIAELEAKMSAEQLALLKTVVQRLVQAAEQSGLSGQISAEGKAKKQWVLDKAIAEVKSLGLDVNVSQIDSEIEAAVSSLFTNKLVVGASLLNPVVIKDPALPPSNPALPTV